VSGLTKHFPVTRGVFGRKVGDVRAVDDLSFDILPGETLGLVGESGCGKTTVGRCVLRLLEPTAGQVLFDGADVTHVRERDLTGLRRNMQVIFQDPFSSLNPRMRVVDIIGEAIEFHGLAKGRAVEDRVVDLLRRVGLSPGWINRYPHEFSGGQRQRIGIARAIALEPKLIVCDEAVSALDVSIQAQIVNLLIELRREMNLAYLFIAHDLSVVRHISQRVAVMYLGELAELSPARRLFERPSHPYTRALLSAIPVPDPRRRARRLVLHGDVPTPMNPPSGCRFHTRCPAVLDRCSSEKPKVIRVEDGHEVACVHAEGLGSGGDWFAELSRRIDEASARNAAKSGGAVAGIAALSRGRSNVAEDAPPRDGADSGPSRDGRKRRAPRESSYAAAYVGFAVVGFGYLAAVLGSWTLAALLSLAGYALVKPRVASRSSSDAFVTLGFLLSVMFGLAFTRMERHRTARHEVQELSKEIAAYERLTGSYPKDLGELGWRLYSIFEDGRAVDPWGRPFRYKVPGTNGRPFDLGTER
jgi:oligopeptide/dipeptide ABC transporter ATP-binding protein